MNGDMRMGVAYLTMVYQLYKLCLIEQMMKWTGLGKSSHALLRYHASSCLQSGKELLNLKGDANHYTKKSGN